MTRAAAVQPEVSLEAPASLELTDFGQRVRNVMHSSWRNVLRFAGAALSVAALALLIVPVGGGEMSAVLSKLMLALVMGFGGVALWQQGSPSAIPEMEIDVVRRELRLVYWTLGVREVVLQRRFSQLGAAQILGQTVQMWDADDRMLVETTVRDTAYLRSLKTALRNEGVEV